MHTSDVTLPPHSAFGGVMESFRPLRVPWNSPRFWTIQAGVLTVMAFHTLLLRVLPAQDLASIPRPVTSSLMLIPVLYAALTFGVTGAIATATWATTLFAIHWIFELTDKSGKVHRIDEVALQEWRGDRIFRERFFYDPSRPAT